MNNSVEVYTVDNDDEASNDGERLPSQQQVNDEGLVAAVSATPGDQQEPLVEVMQSLREQLNRLESSYAASHANSARKSNVEDLEPKKDYQQSLFDNQSRNENNTSFANDTSLQNVAPPPESSSSVRDNLPRYSGTRLTPPRQPTTTTATSTTSFGDLTSPLRYEPSVITEDQISLQSERPPVPTRTPPRSSVRMKSAMNTSTLSENREHSFSGTPLFGLPGSSRTESSATRVLGASSTTTPNLATPSYPLQSPAPLSATKNNNQSFVSSYLEPEPVQTPSVATRRLQSVPELQLLDTLLGTVEALKRRVEEQQVQLDRVERNNRTLEQDLRYWRAEAAHWREEGSLRRDYRRREEESRRHNWSLDDDTPELHRDEEGRNSRRDLQRDEERRYWRRHEASFRDSPSEDRRQREQEGGVRASNNTFPLDESRRSTGWGSASRQSMQRDIRNSPRYPTNGTSPGSLFVDELSSKLPLDTEQYEVLVSLMNRHFGDESIRRGR